MKTTYFPSQKSLTPKKLATFKCKVTKIKASSCNGARGRAVASDSRSPRFESSHRQKKLLNIYSIEKAKIKKKRQRMAHF